MDIRVSYKGQRAALNRWFVVGFLKVRIRQLRLANILQSPVLMTELTRGFSVPQGMVRTMADARYESLSLAREAVGEKYPPTLSIFP